MIRLGVHTIVWGESCTDLDKILREAKDAGYSGIELFQNPASFLRGEANVTQQQFLESLKQYDIELLGMCFGSFEDRVAFVEGMAKILGLEPNDRTLPYIYTDQWGPECVAAMEKGLRVAIHPHMYQPIQTIQEAEEYLKLYPKCELLPDTAHMTIAGEDLAKVIKEWSSRCAAIHLKDWQSNVGRSYQFYARGFCGLGEGIVKWDDLLNFIGIQSYRPGGMWLVVDQDRSSTPRESMKASNDWVRKNFPRGAFERGVAFDTQRLDQKTDGVSLHYSGTHIR